MSDIVNWLRSVLHNDRSVELHCQEAANLICELRDHNESLTIRFNELWERYKMLARIANELQREKDKSFLIATDSKTVVVDEAAAERQNKSNQALDRLAQLDEELGLL
jgi:hypothetical protein